MRDVEAESAAKDEDIQNLQSNVDALNFKNEQYIAKAYKFKRAFDGQDSAFKGAEKELSRLMNILRTKSVKELDHRRTIGLLEDEIERLHIWIQKRLKELRERNREAQSSTIEKHDSFLIHQEAHTVFRGWWQA